MERSDSNKKTSSSQNGLNTFRCFFKQHSISSTISIPIRIAPAWGRMLRFGNTTKFKTDEYLQVNSILFYCFFHCLIVYIRIIQKNMNMLNIWRAYSKFIISKICFSNFWNKIQHWYFKTLTNHSWAKNVFPNFDQNSQVMPLTINVD